MIVFPAIDLKDGQVVRLEQGDMARATTFSGDPAAQASTFAAAGFPWLHVVDLNGAIAGHPVNGAAVEAMLAAFPGKVQLGGGLRDEAAIEGWLARGLARVIVSTLAVEAPEVVKKAAVRFPGRIVIALDGRAKGADPGLVAVKGWVEDSGTRVLDLAKLFSGVPLAAFLYTDIERDGLLSGPNLEATESLAAISHVPVIASGGVSRLEDLKAVSALSKHNIEGVVCGRALYDGRITLEDARAVMGSAPC